MAFEKSPPPATFFSRKPPPRRGVPPHPEKVKRPEEEPMERHPPGRLLFEPRDGHLANATGDLSLGLRDVKSEDEVDKRNHVDAEPGDHPPEHDCEKNFHDTPLSKKNAAFSGTRRRPTGLYASTGQTLFPGSTYSASLSRVYYAVMSSGMTGALVVPKKGCLQSGRGPSSERSWQSTGCLSTLATGTAPIG